MSAGLVLAAIACSTSDFTIADIALQAGFYDYSQFTRTFRPLEKTTPLWFRSVFRQQLL